MCFKTCMGAREERAEREKQRTLKSKEHGDERLGKYDKEVLSALKVVLHIKIDFLHV